MGSSAGAAALRGSSLCHRRAPGTGSGCLVPCPPRGRPSGATRDTSQKRDAVLAPPSQPASSVPPKQFCSSAEPHAPGVLCKNAAWPPPHRTARRYLLGTGPAQLGLR